MIGDGATDLEVIIHSNVQTLILTQIVFLFSASRVLLNVTAKT